MIGLTPLVLSGSTDGRGIKVAATAIGSGTTIHTASSTATDFDQIWIWASNPGTVVEELTLGWGGSTDPDDLIKVKLLPAEGLVPITAGLTLKGNASPLVVVAAGSNANKIVLFGHVHRGATA